MFGRLIVRGFSGRIPDRRRPRPPRAPSSMHHPVALRITPVLLRSSDSTALCLPFMSLSFRPNIRRNQLASVSTTNIPSHSILSIRPHQPQYPKDSFHSISHNPPSSPILTRNIGNTASVRIVPPNPRPFHFLWENGYSLSWPRTTTITSSRC